jgi:radical SAM-linked protein
MHASTMTESLARDVRGVRKSGFTIAPEAGTQRMRDVINKNLDEEQILEACRLAFEAGWQQMKLYFMIGLPTETDADVEAQADLARRILALGRRTVERGRVEVTLSASSFVPKPATPFQWLGMDRAGELHRKQDLLAGRVRRGVKFKHHDCETSILEAVFSRGDRSLGPVIERAWRNGARLDGWSEHFSREAWEGAFREEGIDPGRFAHTEYDPSAGLPWEVIDSGVNRKWLATELSRALKGETLAVCGPETCHGCAAFARDCKEGVVAETTGRPLTIDSHPPEVPVEREDPRYRYRARYAKLGRLRFLGHLDLIRAIGRAFRRAGLPLRYSRGYNPKPRISFGPALPVGTASDGEYLDFETVRRLEPDRALEEINRSVQEDLRFLAMAAIRRDVPSLGDSVRAARYRATVPGGTDPAAALEEFRSRPAVKVTRERSGSVRRFDLREEVLDLEAAGTDTVRFTLAVHPGKASVRPVELLAELFGPDAGEIPVVRESILAELGGRMVNPLLAASAVRHHERAVR